MSFDPVATPGVGTYDLTKSFNQSSPKFSFPKHSSSISGITAVTSGVFQSIDYSSPGPGHYNPSKIVLRKSPSYSVRGKPKELKITTVPGPGQYNLSVSMSKGGVSFSKTEKNFDPSALTCPNTDSKNSTPGPGRYNSDKMRSKTPSYSFPTQTKFQSFDKSIPGPGTYNPLESAYRPSGTSYSIGKTPKKGLNFSSSELSNPGPGRYNVGDQTNLKFKTISTKIGKSPRKLHDISKTPGVGQYDVSLKKKTITNCATISKAKREIALSTTNSFNSKIYDETPGPGRYSTINPKKSGGFTFSQTSKSKKIAKSPGPADYETKINSIKPSSNGCKVPQSKRQHFNSGNQDIPGPGRYNTNCVNIKKSSYMATFNKASKNVIVKEIIPGPGHYNLPRYIRDFSTLS